VPAGWQPSTLLAKLVFGNGTPKGQAASTLVWWRNSQAQGRGDLIHSENALYRRYRAHSFPVCFFISGENRMAWKTPSDLKYLKSDEWVRLEGDTGTIGISDYAQDQLNDIVYVELPDVGTELQKGEKFASVESVKAASDMYMPVSGTVTEVNTKLSDSPELINSDPFGTGWIIKISVSGDADGDTLLTAEQYTEWCNTR
jgi:glycine cleavage system H protein